MAVHHAVSHNSSVCITEKTASIQIFQLLEDLYVADILIKGGYAAQAIISGSHDLIYNSYEDV